MASESNAKDVKSSKRLSRTLSLSSLFRRKSRAPVVPPLPVVEEQETLTKSTSLPEPTKQEVVEEENTVKPTEVVSTNLVESDNKAVEVHVPEAPVEPIIEKDSADKVKDEHEQKKEVPSEDAAVPETPTIEIPSTDISAVEALNDEKKLEHQSKEASLSIETKAVEDPATTPELRVDVQVAENESGAKSKAEAVPDSAIELPVLDASATDGSESTPTLAAAESSLKKAAISSDPPTVIPAAVDQPKETSKQTRRSSIFGRIGSLRSKSSFVKKQPTLSPSIPENATSTKSSTSPTKPLDAEKNEAGIRLVQQHRQRAKTAPVKNPALQQKVEAILTQPSHLPMVREKEEKDSPMKIEVTGSGFGQDVYF